MEYLKHEIISYCTLFSLKLSQDELEVYESCMKFMLEKCNAQEIYELTGCELDELKAWHQEIKNMILEYVPQEILSKKYK